MELYAQNIKAIAELEIFQQIVDDFNIEPSPDKSSGSKIFYHCPLHPDNTASMFIDYKTNSWHCFSCGSGHTNYMLVKKILEVQKNPDRVTYNEVISKMSSYHPIISGKRVAVQPRQKESNPNKFVRKKVIDKQEVDLFMHITAVMLDLDVELISELKSSKSSVSKEETRRYLLCD